MKKKEEKVEYARPVNFCLHDLGIKKNEHVLIQRFNKALKAVHEELGLTITKRKRPNYDPNYEINHFDGKFEPHCRQVLAAFHKEQSRYGFQVAVNHSLDELLERYILYPVRKGWKFTPYFDGKYDHIVQECAPWLTEERKDQISANEFQDALADL